MVFILFCVLSRSWTDEMLAIAFEIGMREMDGEFRNRIIKAFEIQGETIERAAESATWINRVERPPYNIKAFNHWKFDKNPLNPNGLNITSNYYSDGAASVLTDNINQLLIHKTVYPWAFVLNFKLFLGTMCDIHSVFHVTELFNEVFPNGDDNAKRFMVKYNGKERSLMSVWENGCGKFGDEINWKTINSTVETLLKDQKSPYDITFLNFKKTIKNITAETTSLTTTYGYAGLSNGDTLSNDYIRKCQEITTQQVVKAGYGIQGILKKMVFDIYDDYRHKTPTFIRTSEVVAWTLLMFLLPTAVIILFQKFCGDRF